MTLEDTVVLVDDTGCYVVTVGNALTVLQRGLQKKTLNIQEFSSSIPREDAFVIARTQKHKPIILNNPGQTKDEWFWKLRSDGIDPKFDGDD